MPESREFKAAGLQLGCAPAPGLILLRLRADDVEARAIAAGALGVALPTDPARPIGATGLRLYWTAPDAVLLDVGQDDVERWIDRLTGALDGRHAALHALGDARTRFIVAGSSARQVLAKGTGIDLDPRRFPVGGAALTRLAQLGVLIECTHDKPVFALIVERPVEDHLWSWLVDAARSLPR
jgi:sarcosine oxidase, subunit gamma